MRLLADENVPRTIVVWLRDQGHHVLYAAEARKQTSDSDLLSEAEASGCVIMTEDKDFGDLVFRDQLNRHGVILLRMENLPASLRLARLQLVWAIIESNLPRKFVVVTQSKVRVRALTLPSSGSP